MHCVSGAVKNAAFCNRKLLEKEDDREGGGQGRRRPRKEEAKEGEELAGRKG